MKNIIVLVFILATFCSHGQSDSLANKPFASTSLQVGFPALVGLNLEFALPKPLPKYTAYVDWSFLPFNIQQTRTMVTSWQFGMNYHFRASHSGFYLGADAGSLNFLTTRINKDAVDYTTSFITVNAKAGFKSKGRVFVRLEAGYGLVFFDLENANDYLSNTYDVRIKPSVSFLHLPNFKVGVGLQFFK